MTASGPTVLHADAGLAARLERLCALEMRRFAETARTLEPDGDAAWIEVAGGVAAYVGACSPVNAAFGMGMSGPVEDAELAMLEAFYMDRGASPVVGVCPLAHPSFMTALRLRRWVLDGFEHVMVRLLGAEDLVAVPTGIEITPAESDEDRGIWALVAATGFSAPLDPIEEQVKLAAIAVERPGTRLYIAWVDGKAAGTGELYIEDGVAWLSADTTLPQFRGRGVQQALQRHRLAEGAARGCTLAATECAPGSGSQRNMERVGFRIAYTRADLTLPRNVEGTAT